MSLNERDTSLTPADWRAKAAERRAESQASYERSDTDGFVSQWAADKTASMYDLWAELAEHGYQWEFDALYTADGQLIDGARYVETRYGWSWVYDDAQGKTVWFRPSEARDAERRLATDRRKGHTIGLVRRDAYVDLSGGGRGLAGAMNVRPVVLAVRESARTPVVAVSQAYYSQW